MGAAGQVVGVSGANGRTVARWAVVPWMLASLVACGGGGGATAERETPQGNTPTGPVDVGIDAVRAGANALNFVVDETMASATALDKFGEPLLAQWNPRDPANVLTPGVKISFHGQVAGCQTQGLAGGPADAIQNSDLGTDAASVTQVQLPTISQLKWMPRGDSTLCDGDRASGRGPSFVYLNPASSNSGGGLAMLTRSGPQANGAAPFMAAYDSGGVDGRGLNANGLGTFIGIRRAWWADDAVRPFVASSGNGASSLRLVSRQGLGLADLGDTTLGGTVQVKQQIMMEVINTACQAARPATTGPCQIQYLFNVAVARNGVTDWASFAPPSQGHVWFDADQGSVPIVEGQVPEAGVVVADRTSGLALFSSQGNSTRHATFKNLPFDLRVDFPQLSNAMRLVAAAKLNRTAAQVVDSDLATMYGARWNDPTAWTLVHLSAGQEVYDDRHATRRARIAGAVHQLHLGSLN